MDQEGIWAAVRGMDPIAAVIGRELRSGSRRPWRHLVRFSYLLLLATGTALAYQLAIGDPTKAMSLSRMASAGQVIVTRIVFFEFFAVQGAVVILLASSIGGELDGRTLAVLRTSLLTNWQIVAGKLLAGLSQVIILLACSLPVLMLLRVLGGVPWEYILSSLYIILTAALIAGAVTIAVSATVFKFGRTIFLTLIILSVTHVVGSVVASTDPLLAMLTPMGALTHTTRQLRNGGASTSSLSWWVGYSFLEVAFLGILVRAGASFIRSRALPMALGPPHKVHERMQWSRGSHEKIHLVEMLPDRYLDALVGTKEAKPRQQAGLTVSYAVFFLLGIAGLIEAHATLLTGLLAVGLAKTLVTAAATICPEKRAGTWPGLLTMPLGDWQLLGVKAEYVLRRCRSVWLLLGIHLVVFVMLGLVHPAGALGVGMMSFCAGAFAFALGAFLSARLTRTRLAALCSCGLAFSTWVAMPLLVGLAVAVGGDTAWSDPLREWGNRAWLASPLTHVWIATVNSPGFFSAIGRHTSSDRPYFMYLLTMPSAWTALAGSCVVSALYAALALLCGWRAIRHFRT